MIKELSSPGKLKPRLSRVKNAFDGLNAEKNTLKTLAHFYSFF